MVLLTVNYYISISETALELLKLKNSKDIFASVIDIVISIIYQYDII